MKNTQFNHYFDWLTSLHHFHAHLYSFSCVLTLQKAITMIQPYMFEPESDPEIRNWNNATTTSRLFQHANCFCLLNLKYTVLKVLFVILQNMLLVLRYVPIVLTTLKFGVLIAWNAGLTKINVLNCLASEDISNLNFQIFRRLCKVHGGAVRKE